MAGFVKLSRDILDWEWYDDPNTFRVFFHLMLNANYEDKKYHGVDIKRGSMVTVRTQLAADLGMSERNIRTALKHLKSTNEVTIKTTNKFSIITICNFERWQGMVSKSDQQLTDDRPASDQQVTTPKEIEEIKKEIREEYTTLLSSAKSEFLRVKDDMQKEIDELRTELEKARKERKQRAKPIPRTLGGFARAAFEEFYKGLKGIDYEWSAKDANNMKLLLQKIQHSRENREVPLECDDEKMIEALKGFFSFINDPWLLDHLDVANINSKYNEIVAAAKAKKNIKPSMEVGRIITEYDTSKFDNDKTFQ